MTDLTDRRQDALYQRVAQIIEAARTHVSRTVNTAMVHAYWHIGREIVEVEQEGKERAEYGETVVKRLAARSLFEPAEKGAALRHLSPALGEPLFPPLLSCSARSWSPNASGSNRLEG